MCFDAGFGTAAVRYASVGAGLRGPSGPPTVAEPATDGRGPAHGRARTSPRTGAQMATDRAGGRGCTDRPQPDSHPDLPFQDARPVSPSPSSPTPSSASVVPRASGCTCWRRAPSHRCSLKAMGKLSAHPPGPGRPLQRAYHCPPRTAHGVPGRRSRPRQGALPSPSGARTLAA